MTDHSQRDEATDEKDESTGLSKADLIRQKLKVVMHYGILGFAPVVAIIALVVAIIAVSSNRSGMAQFGEVSEKLEALNAGVSGNKTEIENLKFIVSRQKTQLEEEKKKQDELTAKIVQDLSQLQQKMKISPTLAQRLHLPVTEPIATSVVEKHEPVAAPVPVKPTVATPPVVPVAKPDPAPVKSEPAKLVPVKPAPTKQAPAKPPATADDKKQLRNLKEAIDQFNQK